MWHITKEHVPRTQNVSLDIVWHWVFEKMVSCWKSLVCFVSLFYRILIWLRWMLATGFSKQVSHLEELFKNCEYSRLWRWSNCWNVITTLFNSQSDNHHWKHKWSMWTEQKTSRHLVEEQQTDSETFPWMFRKDATPSHVIDDWRRYR